MSAKTSASPPGFRQLRTRRLTAGFGVRETARAAGLDPSHLIRIETGRTTPNLETLHRIAHVLGLTALAGALAPFVATASSATAEEDDQAPAVLRTPGGPDRL